MKRLLYFLSVAAIALGLMVSCQDPDDSLSAPTGLEAVDITGNSATLEWQHQDADRHEVVLNDGEVNSVTEPTLRLDNLTPDTQYTWKVRSGKGELWSAWVEGPEFTTEATSGSVAAPTALAATEVTYASAILTWQNSNADRHEVAIDGGEAKSVTAPTLTLGNLTPKTEYTWKVRSGKGGQWSEWVDGPEFTTEGVPAPYALATIGITVDSGILEWQHQDSDGYEVIFNNGEAISIAKVDGPLVRYKFVDLDNEATYTWKVRSCKGDVWSEWTDLQEFTTKSLSLLPDPADMVFIEGGTFMMGCEEEWASAPESPVHQVTVSDFYISKFEVTQAQWFALMDFNPCYHSGDTRPVDGVFFGEALNFIERLNAVTGKNYALPTEAQWEFAARGGNQGHNYKYAGSNNIDDVAWYHGNSAADLTHTVGTKQPNELGLYDMTGNVMEWCSDWYGEDYYSSSPQNDPEGPDSGPSHVVRGGGWSIREQWCHVTFRQSMNPAVRGGATGFRLTYRP